MALDGPIPLVPYMCGALAGTAYVARRKAWSGCAGSACSGNERDPGLVQLAIYSLLVIAGTGLGLFTDKGGMWLLLVCFANPVLLDREGRRAWVRRTTREPMTLTWWQFLVCLVPMAPLLFFLIGVVIFNDGRPPEFSPETKAIFFRVEAACGLAFDVCRGFVVAMFSGMLLIMWWRKIMAMSLTW